MGIFQDFEDEFGPPENCLSITDDVFLMYESLLPAELIAQWRQVGLCSYGRGLLWFADPRQFEGVIDEWIEGDDVSKPIVFLRTAFAHLYFWHKGSVFSLDVHRGSVSEVTPRISRIFSLLCDPEIKEKILRASLFENALKELGPIDRDECYGFEPAIAVGGPGTLETLRRVKIREQLGILAQLLH